MIPSFLLQKENYTTAGKPVRNRLSFIDKTARNVSGFILNAFLQQYILKRNGLLQKLDSRVKIGFLFAIILTISFTHTIVNQVFISATIVLLFIGSRVNVYRVYKRILFLGFFFGFLIFVPASLNIITPGTTAFSIVKFNNGYTWWVYTIPQEITVTHEGIAIVMRLTLRVVNSVAAVMLILYTTSFEHIIRSMAWFGIPSLFLLTLTMSYKFIFILSQTIEESYLALKMRWWNRGKLSEAEYKVAGRIGFVFRKSWEKYDQTYMAMVARGFTGSVKLKFTGKPGVADYVFVSIAMLVFAFILLFN